MLQISAATGGDRYEKYQYTADGFLAEVDYSTDNVNFSSVAEYSLDEQGRATDYKEYGILNSSNTHAVLYERTASYDAIGQVSSDTVSRQMSGSSGTQSFVINGTYTYTDTNGHWLGGDLDLRRGAWPALSPFPFQPVPCSRRGATGDGIHRTTGHDRYRPLKACGPRHGVIRVVKIAV